MDIKVNLIFICKHYYPSYKNDIDIVVIIFLKYKYRYMELLEYHFSNLKGNLYHDKELNKYEMFSNNGTPMHVNYLTFKELFKEMNNKNNLTILESGISSAGTNSTYLFNEYIKKYGGRFWSVDINKDLIDTNQGNMC